METKKIIALVVFILILSASALYFSQEDEDVCEETQEFKICTNPESFYYGCDLNGKFCSADYVKIIE